MIGLLKPFHAKGERSSQSSLSDGHRKVQRAINALGYSTLDPVARKVKKDKGRAKTRAEINSCLR